MTLHSVDNLKTFEIKRVINFKPSMNGIVGIVPTTL